jgi:hypothetical protein
LVVDSITGRVYMTYNFILSLDPATNARQGIYTFLSLSDVLADPSTNYLYALTNDGFLHVLGLSDYTEVARLDTQAFDNLEKGQPYWGFKNVLSLDPSRHRLYVSGDRTQIIDTRTLTVSASLDTPGQLTPDLAGDQLFITPPCQCSFQQCNTLILDPDTLTGTTTLFPSDSSTKNPCIFATRLDEENRLLYADINNGAASPGNNGNYFSVFDISGSPHPLTITSYLDTQSMALDPLHQRAFATRSLDYQSFMTRFERQGQAVTPTLELAGASGSLWYDPSTDRLYAAGSSLRVFDGDLALLAEISLPGFFDLGQR